MNSDDWHKPFGMQSTSTGLADCSGDEDADDYHIIFFPTF